MIHKKEPIIPFQLWGPTLRGVLVTGTPSPSMTLLAHPSGALTYNWTSFASWDGFIRLSFQLREGEPNVMQHKGHKIDWITGHQ